jgi:hypothetical protein
MKRIHKHLEKKEIPHIAVPDFYDLVKKGEKK